MLACISGCSAEQEQPPVEIEMVIAWHLPAKSTPAHINHLQLAQQFESASC